MTKSEATARATVRVDGFNYRCLDVKHGGMGRVFILERFAGEPWDPVYRPRVAVKTFSVGGPDSPVGDEHVRNELNIWIGLTHRGIVPLRKIVRLNFNIGALMPAYSGSLLDEIRHKGPFNGEHALQIILQLCAALNHALSVNAVLHLDMKAANVLVDRSESGAPICRISDWGIASIQRELADSLRVPGHSVLVDYTGTYNSFGTLQYMAPERFVQGTRATLQCDIYSLGILLYELLTGRLPASRNLEEHVDLLISGGLLSAMIRDLSALRCEPKLIGAIETCLIPIPEARYSTYADVVDALRRSQPVWRRVRLPTLNS